MKQLILLFDDVDKLYAEWLPKIKEWHTFQYERSCIGCHVGNCYDWWFSRFSQDDFSSRTNFGDYIRENAEKHDLFPELWRRYERVITREKLFGHATTKNLKTHWMVFYKPVEER